MLASLIPGKRNWILWQFKISDSGSEFKEELYEEGRKQM